MTICKEEVICGLIDLYLENTLKEKDECAVLNALTYLGYDITLL